MDELSRISKAFTLAVMAGLTAAAVWVTLTYGDMLMKLAVTYGPADQTPQLYLWGGMVAVCLAVWIVAYGLLALIQRRFNVWGWFGLLPLLLLAVSGVNFGPTYGPPAWDALHYKLFEEADQKAITAVKEENLTDILVNSDLCQSDLKKLGFPDFMRAYNLGAPHGLENAREGIKKARAAVRNCQERDNARVEKFRRAISALDVSEKAKSEALAIEFGSGAEADRIQLRRIEAALVEEFERMLDDLAASKGRWYASSNQILFGRQRDLDTFNDHIAKARKLIAEGDVVFVRMRSRDKTHYVVVRPYTPD